MIFTSRVYHSGSEQLGSLLRQYYNEQNLFLIFDAKANKEIADRVFLFLRCFVCDLSFLNARCVRLCDLYDVSVFVPGLFSFKV